MLQGILMIESLRKYDDESKIIILALDKETQIFLSALKIRKCDVISLFELEAKYPKLLNAKVNRYRIEYYFTITPALIKYSYHLHPDQDFLSIYLDADLFFFDNPNDVLSEMDSYSIGIIPHRFNEKLVKKMSRFGKYNVGMVAFKSDAEGTRVLDWWFEACVAWCYDIVENGRFADQGYLNNFEKLSSKVLVINHLGANLAPWNVANYNIETRENNLYVDDFKLVFFHFHNLKIYLGRLLIPHIFYRARLTETVKINIYGLYLKSLLNLSRKLNLSLNESMYVFQRRQNFRTKIYRGIQVIFILLRRDYITINKR
jgi:hypothetical protein